MTPMFKTCEMIRSRYDNTLINNCSIDFISIFIFLIILTVCIIIISMAVMPVYNVWASRKHGEAELAEANFEQQIQIATATARFNAAEMNKKAAIVEAEAVAAQITTIGEHLKQHDLYLRWQWIEMMKHRDGETIYVATEGSLPILEANRNIR